jgi:hypothetical protein
VVAAASIEVDQGFVNLLNESWKLICAWGRFIGSGFMYLQDHYPEPTWIAIAVIAVVVLLRARRRSAG